MFSKLARPATAALRLRAPAATRMALFHSGRALCAAKASSDATTDAPVVDKTNPLYAPDNFEAWRNEGYSNLAPRGWKEWSDLPAPYKYYDVKVDPKDVENEGFLWKTMTNWKTALPITALLALPAFVFDVVIIDERFELMLIFWSTMAVFQANFGATIKKSLTDQIDQIRNDLLGAEKKYNTALDGCIEVHRKGEAMVDHLRSINEAERAIKALEASARTRQIKIDQRAKYVDMLNYLVSVSDSRDGQLLQVVTARARTAVEKTLSTDKALQLQLVEDAIKSLQSGEKLDGSVPALFSKSFNDTCDIVDREYETRAVFDSQQKDLFNKRFDFSATVTEDMLKKAKSDAAEWALLVAKCGGATPAVGVSLAQRSPLEFVQ